MTLISEDLNDNVDVDIKNNIHRKSVDFKQIIEDHKTYKSKEIIMAVKKEPGEENEVKPGRGQATETSELTDQMMTLTLSETRQLEKKPGTSDRSNLCNSIIVGNKDWLKKNEPQEVDECSDEKFTPEDVVGNDSYVAEEDVDSRQCDSLVKLEAPSLDDNEDSEEHDPDDPAKLRDRGPTNGHPSYFYPEQRNIINYDIPMPKAFPVYSNAYSDDQLYQGQKNKRTMDKVDNKEPFKYIKPQNDLSNPALNIKSMVNNCQMSGCTIVSSPEAQPETFVNDFFPQDTFGVMDDLYPDLTQENMVNIPYDEGIINFMIDNTTAGPQTAWNIQGKYADDGNSDGYQSEDLTSPMPSPQSQMEVPSGSPPRTPMSSKGLDSGVDSPMSEDSMFSEIRSPYQQTLEPYQKSSSPYYPMVHQYIGSPQQLARRSPPHGGPQTMTYLPYNHQQTFPSGSLPQQQPATVQQHQIRPNNSCNVPAQFSATPQPPVYEENYRNEFVENNLHQLYDALVVVSEDLVKMGNHKEVQCAPINIPKTVNTAEDPADSLLQQRPSLQTMQLSTGPCQVSSAPVQMAPGPHQVSSMPVQVAPGPPRPVDSSVQRKSPNQVSTSPPKPAPLLIPVIANGLPQNCPAQKVAIPNLRKNTKTSVLNAQYTVVILPQQKLTRYVDIRPKESFDANKTPAAPVDTSIGASSGGSKSSNMPPPPPPLQQTQNQANKQVSLITIARRVVAEMPRTELERKDADGDMVLHVTVCKQNCLYLVQALLERLFRENLEHLINAQNDMGQTPLYLAVSSNHHKVVKLLIEKKADVNPFAECKLPSGEVEKSSAIHCASSRGDKYLETLKELLQAPDINVHQFNSDGHTPLNCAILCHGKTDADGQYINSIPIIQALLEAGADPNLQTQKSGKTSMMFALESRDIDLIEKMFQLVDPVKLPLYLKSNAFDGSTCQKIADSVRQHLKQADQQRLIDCMRPRSGRSA